MSGHYPWKGLKRKSNMTDTQKKVLNRLELYIEVLDYVCKTYQAPHMMRLGITEYNGPVANKNETLALIEKAKIEWGDISIKNKLEMYYGSIK